MPPENDLSLDVSQMNAIDSLDLEAVTKVVNLIHDPTVQIIEETLATGDDTERLLYLCARTKTLINEGYIATAATADAAKAAITDIDTMRDKILQDPQSPGSSSNITFLNHLWDTEFLKSKHIQKLPEQLSEVLAIVNTTIKVLQGLLADQREHGDTIKTGVGSPRYAFTCRTINASWEDLQGALNRLLETQTRLKKVEELRGLARSVFNHSRRNGQMVLDREFAELSAVVQALTLLEAGSD